MPHHLDQITQLIVEATARARRETSDTPEPGLTQALTWPISCVVGPGLEGAIACESKVGYVNGSKGWLIYRGYDIFDLCASSTFEEVSYLLLHGSLPTKDQLDAYKATLARYRYLPKTLRRIMSFPLESMKPMAALRLGANLSHQEFTVVDQEPQQTDWFNSIASDEDSIAMETVPMGSSHAIYEFPHRDEVRAPAGQGDPTSPLGLEPSYHLIAGLATITAAIGRIRRGLMPLDPDPELGHAANLLYMLTGRRPTPVEERIMDVCLILHADHGMNASTFAAMVVASTQADTYFSVGAGISALSGPLHGGANELVLDMIKSIGGPDNVAAWYEAARVEKPRIPGFGHRVYKAYDPRARVLQPLALALAAENPELADLVATAGALEKVVVADLGAQKKVFPNVDYYSGLVYAGLGIPRGLFTPLFAVSRVAGWTARVLEYMENNRIFRPRAVYTGPLRQKYTDIALRPDS